jgi:tetratricopeptide (TPR) repeat protein
MIILFMSDIIFQIKPNINKSITIKKKLINGITNNMEIIFYIAAFSTICGGIMHLLMLGPALKPVNFPMQLLPYTDGLFTISGIMQIFWAIPMIKKWGTKWYYIGLVGTIGLSLLLLMTRIPNGITNLPLEDKNPMALLTEVFQLLFIAVTAIIIINERQSNRIFKKMIENLCNSIRIPNTKNKSNDDDDEWFRERYSIKNQVIEENSFSNNSKKNIKTVRNVAKELNMQGIKLRRSGRDNEAIKCFEQALKINPVYTNALYNMGLCLNKIGRKDEAIETYDKAKCLLRTNWR